MNNRRWILAIPILVFLLLAYFLWQGLYLNPTKLPSTMLNHPLPPFNVKRFNYSKQMSNQDFANKTLIFVVWASWCPECQNEQPFLQSLKKQGYTLYGLNYKDNINDARDWLTIWGNPFSKIALDPLGKLSRKLGVYGAPETFLIKDGIILYRHVGVLTPTIWQNYFLPLM